MQSAPTTPAQQASQNYTNLSWANQAAANANTPEAIYQAQQLAYDMAANSLNQIPGGGGAQYAQNPGGGGGGGGSADGGGGGGGSSIGPNPPTPDQGGGIPWVPIGIGAGVLLLGGLLLLTRK